MSENRLFLSVELPCDVKSAIESYLKPYQADVALKRARWTLPENLHITGLFLGNVHDVPLTELFIKKVCEKTKPFTLLAKGVTLAPSLHCPRMIWLEFQENNAFSTLAANLTQELHTALFQLTVEEAQKYKRPHITLARFPFFLKKTVLFKEYLFPCLSVERLSLMQSDLNKKGPRYTKLADFPLLGAL